MYNLIMAFTPVAYILCEMYVFFSLFTPRFSKGKTALLYMLRIVLSLTAHFLLLNHMALRTPIEWILVLAFVALTFKEPFLKKAVVYLGMVVLSAISEGVGVLGYGALMGKSPYFQGTVNEKMTDSELIVLIAMMHLIFFIFLIAYVSVLKRKSDSFEKKSYRYILMYALTQILMMFVIFQFFCDYGIYTVSTIATYFVTVFASIGFGAAIIRMIKKAAEEKARAEQVEVQMKLSDEHFRRLQLQYEQYRKLRHDYYNHIGTIKGIENETERNAYIDELTKKIESHRGVTFCSNAAVDALLFNEKTQADKVGVKIEFKIADIENLTISNIDLCTVLSNLIDNAIRGASEMSDPDKRFVSVSVFRRAGQLVVSIRNGSMPPQEGLSTTKKNEKSEHGLGLNIVRELAEKHDGAAVYDFRDGVFESSVCMAE